MVNLKMMRNEWPLSHVLNVAWCCFGSFNVASILIIPLEYIFHHAKI